MGQLEIAVHEAGHVIAHVIVGQPFVEVTIVPSEIPPSQGRVTSGWTDALEYHGFGDDALRAEFLRQAVFIAYAGFAAQLMFNPQADPHGVSADDVAAHALAEEYLASGNTRRWLNRQARNARVVMSGHRDAVEAVAVALLRRRTLTARAVRAIVSSHVEQVPDAIDYANLRGSFCDRSTVATIFRLSANRLSRWDDERRGPKVYRIGRLIRYHVFPDESEGGSSLKIEHWS